MGRIMAIDYGQKRVGIAVTDPFKMIPGPLATIRTHEVFGFLDTYMKKEEVETLVLGYPKQMNNQDSESFKYVKQFQVAFIRKYPEINVVWQDERFTSLLAGRAMLTGGMKKQNRKKKENLDKISAVIILQSYMEGLDFNKDKNV